MVALHRLMLKCLKHDTLDQSQGILNIMGVFDLYKPFRNKVVLLSYDEALYVIWAYSQYLQVNEFRIPNDIEVNKDFLKLNLPQIWIAEWELELLAKEVILNGDAVAPRGHTLRSWKTLSALINQLKALENDIYGLHGSSDNVRIELIRIAHRQFIWQGNRPNSTTTIRYFKIFDQPQINEICVDRLGLPVRDIYLCGIGFWGHFLSQPAINAPFSSSIERLSNEKVERFLSFTCRTISELKPLFKSEQQYDDTFAYAYNSLRAFPLIRMRFQGNDAIVCPLPTLLFWRITGGLYYELLGNQRFPQAWGDSFQAYVGQVIERTCPEKRLRLIAEQKYGTKKARKASVDWIVSDEDSAIFLECKAKRLSWNAKSALGDLGPLEADIDDIASAVVQVYRTHGDYIAGQYPHFPFAPNRKVYPVITTLEDWYFFGDAMFDRLWDAVVTKLNTANIPRKGLNEMPYSVWSIAELEVAMQIINAVGTQAFLNGKISDSDMTRWTWHGYMKHCFPEYFPPKKLFSDEYNDIFSGLAV